MRYQRKDGRKMKLIVLVQRADGTVNMTVEDAEKLVEDAYNQGYEDGRASAQALQCPNNSPTWQKDSYVFTCKTPDVTL